MNGWVGVELRHLAALAAVAEEQSFRGAAQKLGYVQSAVSQRIAQLELAVGARLVERSRGHRDVSLTEAGAALLRHAERIELQMGAARAELRELADESRSARLRVGAFGGAAARLLPAALAHLARHSPQLRIELREARSDRDLFDAVETGRLDAAFAELPLEPGSYESRRVLVDPLIALVPADSPLAGTPATPSLADLAAQPFVVNPSWRMFELIAAELAANGLEIEARYEASSGAAIQALVAAGLGVSIVPELDVDLRHPGTRAIGLASLLPSRTLVCYWSAQRPRSDELVRFLAAIDVVRARQRWDRPASATAAERGEGRPAVPVP